MTNEYVKKNTGTFVQETAVTGFEKEEIDVKIENNILKIKGNKKEKKDDDISYIHHGIAERNFDIQYKLSEKLDIEKTNVELKNGKLKITIPCKEENKPVSKKFDIQ